MFNDQHTNSQVININSEMFSEKVKTDPDAVLIDVRTGNEFVLGHIPNSKLIDIMSPSFLEEIEQLDKTKNYYLYCRSGNRSYHAGLAMIRIGFKAVFNLQNGILDWYEPLEQGY